MKKIMTLICMLMCILALTGCQDAPADNETTTQVPEIVGGVSFIAQVLEINADSYMVSPIPGSPELMSADKIIVPMQKGVNPQVGDYIKITYNGLIMESYPAQIGQATIELYTEAIPNLPELDTVPNDTQE